MSSSKPRHALAAAHRWAALLMAPVIVLIVLSGAVLAIRPMLEDHGQGIPATSARLAEALDTIDPGGQALSVAANADGTSIDVKFRDAARSGTYDLATLTRIPKRVAPMDAFAFALDVHKNLLVGAHFLVEIASYGLLGLIVAGPLLAWPRLRKGVMGWHRGVGWALFPLVALTPTTALLMILHVGGGNPPPVLPGGQVSIARAIEVAGKSLDAGEVAVARQLRGGAVLLETRSTDEENRFLLGGNGQIVPLTEGPGLIHQLHEGSWAKPWSAMFNLISALALAALTGTGLYSWLRRYVQSKRRGGGAEAQVLVAFATHTGNAARLAEATAQALRRAGQNVLCASLGGLHPRELPGFRYSLVIASTTGDGEIPEQARVFMKQLSTARLDGVRFSLLALGDSRYRAFCAGGATLRNALLERGATESVPWVRADGDPTKCWANWLRQVGEVCGIDAEPSETAPGAIKVAASL
jgi:sulfite reductase (NADPH) flavoprotein alpha-component